MKTLLLTRQTPNGKAVRGIMTFPISPSSPPGGIEGGFLTLENLDFLIPDGTYTLVVTYSPRFKRDLPLVCNVPKIVYSLSPSGERVPVRAGERLGIRFHRGSIPEHSKGCILLDSDKSVSILTSFIKSNEKVLLKISTT